MSKTAISMSDVEFSQKGESASTQPAGDFSAISFPPSESVASDLKYHIFKLAKHKKGRVHVDGICDNVLNPKTQKRERIYLLQGAHSIWESELEPILKDKDSYKRRRRDLLFTDGVCRIRSDWENYLEFARHTTRNVGKRRVGLLRYDFFEYDAAEEQKARLEKQQAKINVILEVGKMDDDQVKKLSSYLGIIFYDEIGQPKTADGIRSELLLKADTQPEIVKKFIGSKEVEIAYLVKKAILDSKIDLQGQSGNAIWAGGKGFICKIPAARKAHEYLTELAMTNSSEGKTFLEQLQTILT